MHTKVLNWTSDVGRASRMAGLDLIGGSWIVLTLYTIWRIRRGPSKPISPMLSSVLTSLNILIPGTFSVSCPRYIVWVNTFVKYRSQLRTQGLLGPIRTRLILVRDSMKQLGCILIPGLFPVDNPI